MSEWHPVVIKLESIGKHPNADTLQISSIFGGYTVIFKEGRFKEGDLAAYIPSDTICSNHLEFDWLGDKKRIKPMRLRGIFSLGILATAPPGMVEGDSVVDYYELKKHVYEEEMPDLPGRHNGDHASPPNGWTIPHYDLDGLRKYNNLLIENEEVIITEKIEGCNSAFAFDGEKLWCKSRNFYLKEDEHNLYWNVAKNYDLQTKLAPYNGLVFFAELYGNVKGFKYDCSVDKGMLTPRLRFFDVWDTRDMKYLCWDDAVALIKEAGLETVPVLYRGAWTGKDLWSHAEGQSVLGGNIREGFVVRPAKERYDRRLGRVILKLKGESYSLKKQ
jgi:RNA ligase (TIGR02306 family)